MDIVMILVLALGGVVAGILICLIGIRLRERRRMARLWCSLEVEDGRGKFSDILVRDLPGPVQRYFHHAISNDAPLDSHVSLKQTGAIKAGRDSPWMSFRASQILTPRHGFVWNARARKGPVFVEVTDHYHQGTGRMQVALFGLVPIANFSGPDLSQSALGRMMAESILVPCALLPQRCVIWESEDDNHIRATLTVYRKSATLNLTIDDQGRLQEVVMQRYGNQTATGEWAYIPFGMCVDEEANFNGYTIPSTFRGGWWYGTERYAESIRFTINEAIFG